MTFCGKCGSKNPDVSEFCWNCGAKISRPGVSEVEDGHNTGFIERYPSLESEGQSPSMPQYDVASGHGNDSDGTVSVIIAGEVETSDMGGLSPKSSSLDAKDEEMHRAAATDLMNQADELRKQAEAEQMKADEIKDALDKARFEAEELEDQERVARYTAEDRKRLEDATRILEEKEREKEKRKEDQELRKRMREAVGGKAAATVLLTIFSSLLILGAFLLCEADCISTVLVDSYEVEVGASEKVHLVDLGLGGIGGAYTFFTFFTLFFALLGFYSPIFSAIGCLVGFLSAALLKSVHYTLDVLDAKTVLSLSLDGMGSIWAVLFIAFVMSIVSLYCLSRCSDITKNSLSDTLRKIWKDNLWNN